MPSFNYTDADGVWSVEVFPSGVRAAQLVNPSAAYLAARAAEAAATPPPPKPLEARISALEAKLGL